MSDEEQIAFAGKVLVEEMPTLDKAWGCEDCRSIRQVHENARCVVCGSSSIFSVSEILMKTKLPSQPETPDGNGDAVARTASINRE